MASSMHGTIFGHFERASDARAAYAQLRRGQAFRPKTSICVRTPGKDHEDLPLAMTHAGGGMLRGILLSGIAGLLCTGLLVALGSRVVGFSAAYAWLGAGAGMFLGALAGMLQGAAEPHPQLLSMEEEGGVVLGVTAADEGDRAWAHEIMRSHAGRVDAPPDAVRPSFAG